MAFSPDSFKKAIGSPMGGAPGAAPAGKPGFDMDSLMNPPGGPGEIGEPGDSAAEEGSETSLEAALEKAGITATPDQLNSIREILGISGGMMPEAAGEGEIEQTGLGAPVPSAPAKPTSKIGKMFGGK